MLCDVHTCCLHVSHVPLASLDTTDPVCQGLLCGPSVSLEPAAAAAAATVAAADAVSGAPAASYSGQTIDTSAALTGAVSSLPLRQLKYVLLGNKGRSVSWLWTATPQRGHSREAKVRLP